MILINKVCIKNDKSNIHCDKLLSKIDEKARDLRKLRRIKSKNTKGDFTIINEEGYQHMIDKVHHYLKFGPTSYYEFPNRDPASHNNDRDVAPDPTSHHNING